MSKLVKVAKYTAGRQWMAKEIYEGLHVHIKRAQESAVLMRESGDNSPVSAHETAFYYHSHRKQYKNGTLHRVVARNKNDTIMFVMGGEALFYFHDHNIVSVLRDKKDAPSPRLRFSLCGQNTKSTRDRLNRYATDLGVKFYCWRHKNTAWAIWVHDGVVFWSPIDNGDSIIATNR
ncbi:MAG: hypothetical protein IIB38_16000 [Candidatus Hydrogenedentes bacterium]|nr:hypothetical protein [Candidatus Hydrogenedentota bacterium]